MLSLRMKPCEKVKKKKNRIFYFHGVEAPQVAVNVLMQVLQGT